MSADSRLAVRTHKEDQEYAAAYDHDWPTSSVPRRPSFYQPVPATHTKGWSKFIQTVKRRAIPWDVVGETIREGDVYRAEDDNRYRFLWTDPTTLATYSLIVELRAEAFAYDHEKHYCITIYRMEH